MERYDYLQAVIEDVKNEIINNYDYKNEIYEDRDGFEQKLNEDLWICDSVTGNASGSYTFNAWQAEEYLCHNFDLLFEALQEFGNLDIRELESAESCDVTIRCYLLGQAISKVLDELEEKIKEGESYED